MVKDNIIRVLRGRRSGLINFSIFGVIVNGFGYKRVAEKISTGRAKAVKSTALPANIAGLYYPNSDIFKFRHNRPNSRMWQSSVIHEATHALIDLKRIPITKVNSDVIAYTSQFIFLRLSNYDFASRPSRVPAISNPALALADSIIQGRGTPAALVTNLQNAIRTHPSYRRYGTDLATSNGI